MPPWFAGAWSTLSARIRWLVLIATLPAVLLVVYQARAHRMDAIAAAEDRAQHTLQSVAGSQRRLIENTRQFLQQLAAMPQVHQPELARCGRYLAEVLSLNASYVNIGVPSVNGDLLCNALPLKSSVNVANRPYFQQAITAREFSVGSFQIDRAAQVASVNFAYPVVPPGSQAVAGAAVAVVSLEWWSLRLTDLGLPEGAVARVSDPDGRVIARYPPDVRELGAPFADADFLALSMATPQGQRQRTGPDGTSELIVFQPLIEAGGKPVATMSLTVPLGSLYAAANRRMWTDIAILLVGLMASFALAHEGLRRGVVGPIQRLLRATDELAEGRYVSGMPATGLQELTELGRRFDRMALTRQTAETQLRQSEENLAITLHSIGDAVVATDAHGYVSRMNPVAERLTGWSIDVARGRPLAEVFRIVNSSTREPQVDPVQQVMAQGQVVALSNHTTLLARDGSEYQIADSAAPIRNSHGIIVGVVLVFSDVSGAYRVRKQLEDNEARFRTLAALSSDWYWEQDAQFRLVHVDGSTEDGLVKEAALHMGKTRWELAAPGISDEWWKDHRALLEQHGEFRDFEFQRHDRSGAPYWVSISGTPMFDEKGVFCGYRGVGKDITARKNDENELRIAAIAFESQEGMIVTDHDTVILRTNRAFAKITGYSGEEAVGRRSNLLASGHHDKAFFDAMWTSLRTHGEWKGEIWNRCKSGEVSLHFMAITAVKDAQGALTHYVATLSDITQRAQAAREIETLAFYDPLTHLPNRRLMMDRLQQAFATSARTGLQGALLCLDLDHFKNLNDTLGHDMGDVLLQQVGQRLSACVREGDTVARLGGDEFLVLLEDLGALATDAAEQSQDVGEKILAALNRPYQLASHHVHSTTSVGAVLFSGQSQTVEDLVKHADLAMYAAKTAGRNSIRFFDPMMQAAVTARAALENDLRTALEQGQFTLHYQAQVGCGVRVVGAEVLIRWHHPTRGLVPPFEFIPLAEETGLILPTGLWVLQTACAQLKRWQDNPATDHLQLAVNVSARQFRQADFMEQIVEVLRQTGARPDRLKLELTESLALDNVDDTIAKMNALRSLGLRFSMDDFGTGQSSLSYLTRLPLDQLKIDQSFVRNIGIQHTDALIVQTIIGMAHSLGIDVIAEGVETEEQRAFLERHGCSLWQGYLFSKPVPLESFEQLMGQLHVSRN
ncbi:MAG: EAL domain-containing protein [Gammaproteobacteria bacterium]|nr:EAL domain-containing protein [Gammaproteobacteria bacterium]MBU1505523.1 EAL domain-containing protein [Gammaproteobacteria bacterium]MBU2120267.1 EAL domain-containing protein [Gammaproteobacteria bacterium]MBU2170755.1 EAL domain-containing protein [Gammaproteobacteria bacterium]MBU2199989.1 EAL domain-containing protein [Gammaproteobacteria bacterium]